MCLTVNMMAILLCKGVLKNDYFGRTMRKVGLVNTQKAQFYGWNDL